MKTWFQAFAFIKFNLYRYTTAAASSLEGGGGGGDGGGGGEGAGMEYDGGAAACRFGTLGPVRGWVIAGMVALTPGCQIGYMDPILAVINWCFDCKIT